MSETNAATETATTTAAAPARAAVIRQWVSVGSVSSDVRVGSGALEVIGMLLKGSVGNPHLAALVVEEGTDEALFTRVRYALTDVGFDLRVMTMPAGAVARRLETCVELAGKLVEAHITSDDLICAIGGADMLSAVAYVAGSWCGGTPLAEVPTTLDACVECTVTPRGIDVGEASEMLVVKPAAKYLICDLDVIDCDPDTPSARLARALMAAGALADNEKAFERLWDRAELVAAGDVEALAAQLGDTAKTRGHIVSATAVALRQSINVGRSFQHALASLLGDDADAGRLLAEGLRFQARLAAGQEELPIDDVLTIDELLDLLELAPVSCDVEPEALVAALKAERFRRSGRFLLGLPKAIGRVRLSGVDDALLLEHATAWCATHARQ